MLFTGRKNFMLTLKLSVERDNIRDPTIMLTKALPVDVSFFAKLEMKLIKRSSSLYT